MSTVPSPTYHLGVHGGTTRLVATEAESRAAFELAIQDAIDERKSAEGLVKTEKNIAHLDTHVKNLKQRLLRLGSWQPCTGGAHDAHFKGIGAGGGGRGRKSTLAPRGVSARAAQAASSLGALGDKIVTAHVGEPLIH